MYKLVFLRHGESEWNLKNRFTGWTDVGLTKKGCSEALDAGKLIKEEKLKFTTIYTSVLKRAIYTMEICLKEISQKNISIKYDWRLNERHYGKLQGFNKKEMALKFGDEKVLSWRRSYDLQPPPLSLNDKRHPRFDKKYSKLNPSQLPTSESLKDTEARVLPFWKEHIAKSILNNKKVLIVAHGNSIRALIKYLDNINNRDIINLNIPTGIPLVYELNKDLKPINNYFLGDQSSISKKIDLISDQGKAK